MMEGERSMEQQKLEVMQNTTKGTRNHSSVAYDFVTLEYHATPAGREIFFPSFPPPFPLFLASFTLVTSQTSPRFAEIIIHLEPSQSTGMQQRFEDDMSKYRAGVRTEKLHRFSSGDGYNPITGAELRPLRLPAKPNNDL